jgi:multiple sugar transport system substrate-binding protein
MKPDRIKPCRIQGQAGNPPDISYNTDSVPQSYSLNILEDVTDVVDELVKTYGAVVPAGAEKAAKIDGKWWAVPFISNCGSWFARKDWLDAKNIQPAAYATWEGRRDVALQISDPAKEQWAWGVTVNRSGDGHGLIMDCIQSFGGFVSDVTGKKVTFNSPETIAAVTFLSDIYTNPKWKPMLPPGVESWTDTSNNEAFLAGKISFTQNALSVYGQLKRDKNPILANTILVRKPQTKDGKILESGGSGWFNIFRGAKNKDMAKQMIFELLKPTNFMPMVLEGGGLFLPAYKNMWTDEVSKMDPNFAPLKEIIFNPDAFNGIAHPANPSALHDAINSESLLSQMMSNVITGKMKPDQAVKEAHDRMVRLWEEGGIKQ